MTALLQGAISGGRALLVAWFVPSLLNVLAIALLIAPQSTGFSSILGSDKEALKPALITLAGTVILGTTLAALQTPLYRILEGYLGWPYRVARRRRAEQLAQKHLLMNRIQAALLLEQEINGQLTDRTRVALQAFRSHPIIGHHVERDAARGIVWRALLEERLDRYPRDDLQVVATRLGNAIRRLEEFGYSRWGLDSQVLWNELMAAAPEQARKQADDARINVDFFVALLYGNLLVGVLAVLHLLAADHVSPAAAIAAPTSLVLPIVWYRVAVVATDDWAAAVRALVVLGRRPLATGMGLCWPDTAAEERRMWETAARHSRGFGALDGSELDEFRERNQGDT